MAEREITEHEAREWCRRHGFEFKSWDGTFCEYRDPRHIGTVLEFGLESFIRQSHGAVTADQTKAR